MKPLQNKRAALIREAIISVFLVLTLFCLPAMSITAADWFNQAQALWSDDRGKFADSKKAIEYLNSAIQLQPDYAVAYNSRGNAYADLGRFKRAIEDYDQAIRIKPDYAYAFINRGDAHYSLGQYQHAVDDCTAAIRLQPKMALAYSNRGKAYAQLKNFTIATKDFNEALRLKPGYVNAYNNRAFAYLLQGNNPSGCLDAQKACELGLCKVLEWAKSKGKCGQEKSGQPSKNETKNLPDTAPVSVTPAKKTPPPVKNFAFPSTEDQSVREMKKIKGIELFNGKIIEGQIVSLSADTVKIKTQDGKILSFSFSRDVYRFIK